MHVTRVLTALALVGVVAVPASAQSVDVRVKVDTQAIREVTEDIREAVYDYVETFLRSDLESNFQHEIDRTVQATVRALLTGQEWALRQYPLATNYDAVEIRAAVAKHAGDGLLTQRIADLEKRVEELAQSLKWERETRSRY